MSESELEKAQLTPNERRMSSTGEASGIMSESELEKAQLAPNERRMSSTGEASGIMTVNILEILISRAGGKRWRKEKQ